MAGVWNALPTSVPLAPVALVDISGAPTPVTLQVQPSTWGYNGVGGRSFDNPKASGGDGALVDDLLDLGGGPAGSAPSGVAVRGYALAPDGLQLGSGEVWLRLVVVPGATSGMMPVGCLDWPSIGHLLRYTFALHTVSVSSGADLLIQVDAYTSGSTALTLGSLAGIQIVESTGGAARSYCSSRPSSLPGCTPTSSAQLMPLFLG